MLELWELVPHELKILDEILFISRNSLYFNKEILDLILRLLVLDLNLSELNKLLSKGIYLLLSCLDHKIFALVLSCEKNYPVLKLFLLKLSSLHQLIVVQFPLTHFQSKLLNQSSLLRIYRLQLFHDDQLRVCLLQRHLQLVNPNSHLVNCLLQLIVLIQNKFTLVIPLFQLRFLILWEVKGNYILVYK